MMSGGYIFNKIEVSASGKPIHTREWRDTPDGPATHTETTKGKIQNLIKDAQICSIEKLSDGNFRLMEECDQWASVEITPDALRLLINYLEGLLK